MAIRIAIAIAIMSAIQIAIGMALAIEVDWLFFTRIGPSDQTIAAPR